MHTSSLSMAFMALLAMATQANGHSWVERMMSIASNGSFVGAPGYARGNVLRTDPQFQKTGDPLMVNLLPPLSQGTTILPSNDLCKSTQQQQNQTAGSPRLSAAAGSMIALQYQENGHVTLPQNQLGKPSPSRGTVYIYGTTQPKTDEKFLDVHKVWNANGTGGDKRGKLLAAMPYDDGRCYQVNGGNISTARQAEFKFTADPVTGTNLWCQNDIALPQDAPTGKPYTLYWVWDWPTQAGVDPGLPNGKPEIYTTCMDVDITGSVTQQDVPEYASQPPNMGAIPGYFSTMAQGKNVLQMADAAAPSAGAPSSSQAVPSSVSSSTAVAPLSNNLPTTTSQCVCPSVTAPSIAPAPPANTMTILVTQTITTVQISTSVVTQLVSSVASEASTASSISKEPAGSSYNTPPAGSSTTLAVTLPATSAALSSTTVSADPVSTFTRSQPIVPITFAAAPEATTGAPLSAVGPSASYTAPSSAPALNPRYLGFKKRANQESSTSHDISLEQRETVVEQQDGDGGATVDGPKKMRSAKFRVL